VYAAGRAVAQSWPVVWLDGSGTTRPLLATSGSYVNPHFSPDGRRLAIEENAGGVAISVYDWLRDVKLRLTSASGANGLAWKPDGKYIVFGTSGERGSGLWCVRSDGAADA
jgi:Tol biopolymer transport system component